MKAIAYYRVSTAAQGRSGLGLEAQQATVRDYASRTGATLLGEFTEVESGKDNNRPKLTEALERARLTGATLVIAKLDRLSRNLAFLVTLQEAGTKFVAADMPEANELTVHIMAAVAQAERKAISQRTKEALAAAKARAAANGIGYKANGDPWKNGARLGNPNGAAALRRAGNGHKAATAALIRNAQGRAEGLAKVICEIQAQGIISSSGIAKALNERHIRTPRGRQWHAMSVKRTLERLS